MITIQSNYNHSESFSLNFAIWHDVPNFETYQPMTYGTVYLLLIVPTDNKSALFASKPGETIVYTFNL